MRHPLVLLASVLIFVGCDEGTEHGGGHGASMQVFVGRGPGPATASTVAASEHGSPEAAPAPRAKPGPTGGFAARTPNTPDEAPNTPDEAPNTPDEAQPTPDEGPSTEPSADAQDSPAAADSPAAPPIGNKSEAEWLELAKVRLGSAKVDGALDPEAVRKGVRSNTKELRQCYAQGLVEAPELTGKVTIEFVIDKKGKVDSSKVKSTTLGDAAVETCVTNAVAGWTFDAPDDGKKVSVRYPFTLSL